MEVHNCKGWQEANNDSDLGFVYCEEKGQAYIISERHFGTQINYCPFCGKRLAGDAK